MDISFNYPIRPSASPFSESPLPRIPGQKLIDDAHQLYEWYQSWYTEHPENFYYLTLIIRIAAVSTQGGNYLTISEEDRALIILSQFRDNLYSGKLKHHEIPAALDSIVMILTDENPKAKLVAHTTRLEFMLLNHYGQDQPQEKLRQCREILKYIIAQITPQLPAIHANAVATQLTKLLDKFPEEQRTVEDVAEELQEAIKGWL